MKIIKIGNHRLNLSNFSVLEENSNIIKGITDSQIKNIETNIAPKMIKFIKENHKEKFEVFLSACSEKEVSDTMLDNEISDFLQKQSVSILQDIKHIEMCITMSHASNFEEFECYKLEDSNSYICNELHNEYFYIEKNALVESTEGKRPEIYIVNTLCDNYSDYVDKYIKINYDVDKDESDYEIYSIFVKANKNCSRKKIEPKKALQIEKAIQVIDNCLIN